MQTLGFFQKASLTLITLNFAIAGGNVFAGSFSNSTFDPNKIDSGIPGNGAFLDSAGRPIYDPWQTPIPGSGGFDLEAIGVINTSTIPEPASVLGILLSGIFGISLRVRHRKGSIRQQE